MPTVVPAVIGPGALTRFADGSTLRAYVQGAMPWHAPGSLEGDVVSDIAAYLARENSLPDVAGPTATVQPGPIATAQVVQPEASNPGPAWGVVLVVLALGLLVAAISLGAFRRARR